MLNLLSFCLFLATASLDGLLYNKGASFRNFIHIMVLLTVWLLLYTLVVNKCGGVHKLLNLALSVTVLLVFKTKSLLLFYVFFEFRVLPITIILFLFGYQPEKLQASLSLLLYTVVSSLPLFLFILIEEEVFMLAHIKSGLITISVTLCFIVKTPMFLLHTWLPKAHVEAPVGGSMVLAGVLLKLGAYGLLIFIPLIRLNPIIVFYISMALIGSIVCSLNCLRQGDLKLLVAYRSVVHIGVVILGIARGTEIGYTSGVIIVLRHGLRSPFLFAFVFWLYESSHSRLIVNNRCIWPVLYWAMLGLVSLNIGVPPCPSLWAELLIVVRILNTISCVAPILFFIFLLSAVYNLFLFTSCNHSITGNIKSSLPISCLLPLAQVFFLSYSSFFCLDIYHLSLFEPS